MKGGADPLLSQEPGSVLPSYASLMNTDVVSRISKIGNNGCQNVMRSSKMSRWSTQAIFLFLKHLKRAFNLPACAWFTKQEVVTVVVVMPAVEKL